KARGDERVGPYGLPESLSLIREIDAEVYSRTGTVPYSRSGLFIRDRGICAYCLGPGDTMDHIMPKSRGGQAEWTNAVVACFDCNQRKADRTPDEAGRSLLRVPFPPTSLDLHAPPSRGKTSGRISDTHGFRRNPAADCGDPGLSGGIQPGGEAQGVASWRDLAFAVALMPVLVFLPGVAFDSFVMVSGEFDGGSEAVFE